MNEHANEPVMVLVVREQEFHTILAALRWYQHTGMGEPANRPDWLHEIAWDSGQTVSLDDRGIDKLCDRINTLALHPPLPFASTCVENTSAPS